VTSYALPSGLGLEGPSSLFGRTAPFCSLLAWPVWELYVSARVRLNKLTDLNANNLVTIPVQVCGPLGYPLGGVAALLGCLVLGGGALVEVMARCSDTGHQALSQIEMESQDDLSVVEAMETFKDALEDIHQSPDADSESRLRKLRKLDSMRATPGDIVQLNQSSRKPGQMFGHRSQNQDPNSVYGT